MKKLLIGSILSISMLLTTGAFASNDKSPIGEGDTFKMIKIFGNEAGFTKFLRACIVSAEGKVIETITSDCRLSVSKVKNREDQSYIKSFTPRARDYFKNKSVDTNERNIAIIQGSQSTESFFNNIKLGGVINGGTILLNYSEKEKFLKSGAINVNNPEKTTTNGDKFILVYLNSVYDNNMTLVEYSDVNKSGFIKELDESWVKRTKISKAPNVFRKSKNIFVSNSGLGDLIDTPEIMSSSIYVLIPKNSKLTSTEGMTKIEGLNKTINIKGSSKSYDVYKF